MHDDPLHPTKAAADYLHRKAATLVYWRHIGRGPKYIKSEGRVFYRQSHLDEFLEDGIVQPSP